MSAGMWSNRTSKNEDPVVSTQPYKPWPVYPAPPPVTALSGVAPAARLGGGGPSAGLVPDADANMPRGKELPPSVRTSKDSSSSSSAPAAAVTNAATSPMRTATTSPAVDLAARARAAAQLSPEAHPLLGANALPRIPHYPGLGSSSPATSAPKQIPYGAGWHSGKPAAAALPQNAPQPATSSTKVHASPPAALPQHPRSQVAERTTPGLWTVANQVSPPRQQLPGTEPRRVQLGVPSAPQHSQQFSYAPHLSNSESHHSKQPPQPQHSSPLPQSKPRQENSPPVADASCR